MEIAENLTKWNQDFKNGWLNEYTQHNKINWNLYSYAHNTKSPSSAGINLSNSRLLLISSAGGYLPDYDVPFDAANPLGDYTIRSLSIQSQLNRIEYAHNHYDTKAVKQDLDVLIPIRHLQSMVKNREIGELSEQIISFMGYQPDINRVITETLPAVIQVTIKEKADAVLLVPS
jgi:hypothetical protein